MYPGINLPLVIQSQLHHESPRTCIVTATDSNLQPLRTLNHLAKLAKCLSRVVSTYLHVAFDCML